MNLTTVKSVREVKKVREIYDSIEIHVRNLNSLKIDTSQYGPVLVFIVMSKLPDDIRLLITRTMPTNEEWEKKLTPGKCVFVCLRERLVILLIVPTKAKIIDPKKKNIRVQHCLPVAEAQMCRVPTVDGNILVRNVMLLRMSKQGKQFCEIKANANANDHLSGLPSSTVTSYLRRKFQQNLISDYVKKQYWKMGANFDNFC